MRSADAAECDWLEAKLGRALLIALTANPGAAELYLDQAVVGEGASAGDFARIAHVMCPKDYVRFRMTGEYAIDVQEASGTLLLDVAGRRWSEEVAEAAEFR